MPATVSSRSSAVLTVGLVLMVTAVAFEGLAAPTVLPATLEELRGLSLYGWAFSGFWLSNLVGISLAGAEADRRGPFLPFVAGTAAFSVGLVVAGVAPDMAWVVAGRIIQGLGAGAIGAITYVAIARGYAPATQPRIIAVISSAWVLPGLVGPALAGWVSEEHSWRWVFLGLAPLLPLAALLVARELRRLPAAPRDEEASRDRRSTTGDALLLTVGTGAVLAATSLGQLLPGLLLGAVGAPIAVRSLRRLLPAGTLTARRGRPATIAVLGLLSVAFFGVEAFVPLAVASVRNAGTLVGGLALTTAAVTWAAGSWVQARLAATRSRRSVTAAGLVLIGIGIALEAAVPFGSLAPIWLAAAAWAIAGLGMGLAYSTATLAIIEAAPPGSEGAASASVQLANTLGIALGTGVAGSVVALSAAAPLGLAPGIVIADLLMLIVLMAALSIVGRMPGQRPAAPVAGHLGASAEHGPTLIP
ncbi:MAG TPA: MFS transporter [Candidatus Limnocylindrales bacterium]|nr:MFS transporter [Candidatus Limnocylindrales bacterium]